VTFIEYDQVPEGSVERIGAVVSAALEEVVILKRFSMPGVVPFRCGKKRTMVWF